MLLSSVLRALEDAAMLELTNVVTSDQEVLRLARRLGANGIPEAEDEGVNSAVYKGIKAVRSHDALLVIPSDLPLLRAADIREVARLRTAGMDVVVSPSQGFDGTNALAFSPSSGLELSYDNNSFWNHLASAARNGLNTAVSCRPGFMFDVDSPEDFHRLASARQHAPAVSFARRAGR